MYCRKCGGFVADDKNFCPKCGMPVNGGRQNQSVPIPQPVTQPIPEPKPTRAPKPTKTHAPESTGTKVLRALLVIFLLLAALIWGVYFLLSKSPAYDVLQQLREEKYELASKTFSREIEGDRFQSLVFNTLLKLKYNDSFEDIINKAVPSDEKIESCCQAYIDFVRSGKESDLSKCYPQSMTKHFIEFYPNYYSSELGYSDYSEQWLQNEWMQLGRHYDVAMEDGSSVFAPVCYRMLDYYEDLAWDYYTDRFSLSYAHNKRQISLDDEKLYGYILVSMSQDMDKSAVDMLLSHVKTAYEVELDVNDYWYKGKLGAYMLNYEGEWFLLYNGEGFDYDAFSYTPQHYALPAAGASVSI